MSSVNIAYISFNFHETLVGQRSSPLLVGQRSSPLCIILTTEGIFMKLEAKCSSPQDDVQSPCSNHVCLRSEVALKEVKRSNSYICIRFIFCGTLKYLSSKLNVHHMEIACRTHISAAFCYGGISLLDLC